MVQDRSESYNKKNCLEATYYCSLYRIAFTYYTISLIIHAVLFVFPGGNITSQGYTEMHHLYRKDNIVKSNTNRLY